MDDMDQAVKIVDDALGLDAADGRGARALLDQETIGTLIFTIQRRGRMSDLGEPLVERLRRAGFAVDFPAKSSSSPVSRLHAARRGERLGGYRSPQ
jgi:hypothetical protein